MTGGRKPARGLELRNSVRYKKDRKVVIKMVL